MRKMDSQAHDTAEAKRVGLSAHMHEAKRLGLSAHELRIARGMVFKMDRASYEQQQQDTKRQEDATRQYTEDTKRKYTEDAERQVLEDAKRQSAENAQGQSTEDAEWQLVEDTKRQSGTYHAQTSAPPAEEGTEVVQQQRIVEPCQDTSPGPLAAESAFAASYAVDFVVYLADFVGEEAWPSTKAELRPLYKAFVHQRCGGGGGERTNKIFVGGLTPATNEDKLCEFFSK